MTMACTEAISKEVVVGVGQDFITQIHMPVPEVFRDFTTVHTWEQWDRPTPSTHHPHPNHLTMYWRQLRHRRRYRMFTNETKTPFMGKFLHEITRFIFNICSYFMKLIMKWKIPLKMNQF